MLSLPNYHLLLLIHARPLVSVPVSGDCHSVSYSPLGSARIRPDPVTCSGEAPVANAGEVDTVEWVPVRELATRVPGDPTRQLRNISLMPALWKPCRVLS